MSRKKSSSNAMRDHKVDEAQTEVGTSPDEVGNKFIKWIAKDRPALANIIRFFILLYALMLPLYESWSRNEEVKEAKLNRSINLTFDLGKAWIGVFDDNTRATLGTFLAIAEGQKSHPKEYLIVFKALASEKLAKEYVRRVFDGKPRAIQSISVVSDEKLTQRESVITQQEFADRICNTLVVNHFKVRGESRGAKDTIDEATAFRALTEIRGTLLKTLNMLEEVAFLRKQIYNEEQSREVIDQKVWGNVVKRTWDLRLFIDAYNEVTYNGRGYRAYKVLLRAINYDALAVESGKEFPEAEGLKSFAAQERAQRQGDWSAYTQLCESLEM